MEETMMQYASTLCLLESVSEVLSNVQCNDDGTFEILETTDKCGGGANFNRNDTLQLLIASELMELTDLLGGDDELLEALQECCDAITSVLETINGSVIEIGGKVDELKEAVEALPFDDIIPILNRIDANSLETSVNTESLSAIENYTGTTSGRLADIDSALNDVIAARLVEIYNYLADISELNHADLVNILESLNGGTNQRLLEIYNRLADISDMNHADLTNILDLIPGIVESLDEIKLDVSNMEGVIPGLLTDIHESISLRLAAVLTELQEPKVVEALPVQLFQAGSSSSLIGCTQTFVYVYSDGTVRDAVGGAVVNMADIQNNIGYCWKLTPDTTRLDNSGIAYG